MGCTVRLVEYFYARSQDAAGEASQLLAALASSQVSLLAFSAIPCGATHAQLTLFPEDSDHLQRVASKLGITLLGPHRAFLIQCDCRLEVFSNIHQKLHEAAIDVYSAIGVSDGKGGFGYLLYVRHDDYERAAELLQVEAHCH